MNKDLQIEPIELKELDSLKGGTDFSYNGCIICNGKCSEGGCGIANGKCRPDDDDDDEDTPPEEQP